MPRKMRIVVACLGLVGFTGASLAQHQGHQMGAPPAGEGSCQANAKEGLKIVEDANRQLEEARQTNSPQQMRAALNGLQSALGEVRTYLSLCVSPAPGSPGTGMGMTGMKGMDHSTARDPVCSMETGTGATEAPDPGSRKQPIRVDRGTP